MPANIPASAPALEQGLQVGQILLLLFYLALIFAGAYFITRFLGRMMQNGGISPTRGGGRFAPGRHIHLVDKLALDREKSILLFEADGKRYLVGVSEHAFTLLESAEAPAENTGEPSPRGRASFPAIFASWKRQEDDEHAPKG
ncbi:MAG: hypothetical protein EOM66_08800 [Clostridia bacterium]|nr:hypothetical protein [Clostridia bacterium]